MKSILLRGGVLLALSAIGSKLFALWRDRLFVEIFGAGQQTDLIFASFRSPDFFYFLLVGLTLSTLLIPRMAALVENREERIESNDDNMNHQIAFFSSFLWGVGVCFGIICILGIFGAQLLIPLVATGFSPELHAEMLPLVRTLCVTMAGATPFLPAFLYPVAKASCWASGALRTDWHAVNSTHTQAG